jgi:hypothetical protein
MSVDAEVLGDKVGRSTGSDPAKRRSGNSLRKI